MSEKAYKFRLYPNAEQQALIQRTFGCCRFIYNYYLANKINVYTTTGKPISRFEQDRNMTILKSELLWLKEVDSTSLQSSLKDLDSAYSNFFRRVKSKSKPGFPKFKSKRRSKQSYQSKRVGSNIVVTDRFIKLPKLGYVRCAVSKQVRGRILSATVSQNPSGKYFVSLCCTDVDIKQYELTGAMVGIDLGIKDLLTASDGNKHANHKYLAKSQKKLKHLQRQLSRKSRNSNNRCKAKLKVARLHEKISNQRHDTLHKLSTQIVKDYDVIVVEDLTVKNMVKNHRLAKSIPDASWGEFVHQLEYKTAWHNKILVKVDRFYPSSQICSGCGYKNLAVKNLAVRDWICPNCEAVHDRDVNAAKNILNEGLRLLNVA